MNAISILFLGDLRQPEFRDARAGMEEFGAVHEAATPAAAEAALADGAVAADVIVVAQAFPGQFSPQAIDRLRRRAPLARIVGLLGSWCEGEMRSGSPWPAVARTYWHQWPTRSRREFSRLAQGRRCSWALPPTASEEERLLVDTEESQPRRQGLVAIRSTSFETTDWLSAACRHRGFATAWQRDADFGRLSGATAAIFDGTDFSDRERVELERLAVALRPAPVIVLLAFPRRDDHRRAISSGAAAVLSKPVSAEDLFWQLDAVT